MSGRLLQASIAAALLLALAPSASAQLTEVELEKSSTRDLYLKKRPPAPASPEIPGILQKRLVLKEKQARAKRKEAIKLLEDFLDTKPTGSGRAEGLFKLAELLWEDARDTYMRRMDRYQRVVEGCRQNRGSCNSPPVEPKLDFTRSEKLYKTILRDHPNFRRTDLVLYLVGFAARQDGRWDEALGYFEKLIDKYPKSPLHGDAWLMIGEHHFQATQWEEARAAYAHVLQNKSSNGFDLALFKAAWCDWKLGDSEEAAKKFKLVLDLAREANRSGSASERRRRNQLRDEALDYLVLVFTEDETIKAKDVYDFLASIGGERYSEAVLTRLADLFFTQAAYERSVEAYRFLIELHPQDLSAAKYQRRIVDAYLEALEGEKANEEIKVLVSKYSRDSAWAKANARNREAVDRQVKETEKLVRGIAKGFHADAQAMEKQRGKPDLDMYRRAAATYAFYLDSFPKDPHAVEVRFLRAEILFFKLKKYEEAGDEYLAVGKTAPVGKYHEDALRKAMAAYKKARPTNVDTSTRRELLPVDRKFAEATDLYATLFPASSETVRIIYENGDLFFRYGDYDEAIKRFGLIVTKYPDHETAEFAGNRILEALNKAEDYENIEHWARKLKKAKAFQSDEEQARLDRLIVESIGKSGEKYAKAGKYEKAAGFYLRIPKEFPSHPLAARSLMNAGVMLEKAKKPEEAASAYLSLADRYRDSDKADDAAFAAAQVYEQVAYFDRAAEAYELCAKRWPRGEHGADSLFNAGVLRQALGQPRRAIRHYELYAERFRKRDDAEEVAFRVGVVYEAADNDGRAERAYNAYLRRYSSGAHAVEATVRAGRAAFSLGHSRRAAKRFKEALKRYGRLGEDKKKENRRWAAEAKYYQGELIYRQYAKIALDVKPRRLERTLDRKVKLLQEARAAYEKVVDVGDPQWATAALYRMGSVFEEFSAKLRDAPIPPGFSKEEKEMYRQTLDNRVIEVEEIAVEVYQTGYQKALELGVYNEYTNKLRAALSRMSPSSFPPLKEAHQTQRLGDRPPRLSLVEEVIRDGE